MKVLGIPASIAKTTASAHDQPLMYRSVDCNGGFAILPSANDIPL